MRCTPTRLQVLRALTEADGHLTAQELITVVDAAAQVDGPSLDRTTV